MAKTTDWKTIFLGLLAVSALLVALSYLGYIHVPGMAVSGAPQATIVASGSCPDTGRVTARVQVIRSILSTTGTETPVNGQLIGIQLTGSTQLLDSFASSDGGFNSSNTGMEIPCGQGFNIVFPSTTSTTYYNELIPMQGVSAAFIDTKFPADLVGTVAVTGQNSTSTPGYATGTLLLKVPASATDTSLYLQLKEASGGVFRGPLMVGIAYNTNNYTDIEVIGASQAACPAGIGTTNDLDAAMSYQKCFVLAAGDLKNYGSTNINLKVVTAAVEVRANFTAVVMDYGARVKNGAVVNEYRNTDTGGTIGATDVTFNVKG